MAFVPGKTSDLFISYAWRDNAPERAIGQEWVSTFHDTLKSRLSKAPLHGSLQPGQPRGEDPVIWFDKRLPSDARITPTIEEAVKGSACLLVVLSPSYNNSPWCHRERELFLEANPDGPIFIVEHLPLMDPKDERSAKDPRINWPTALRDINGRKFWRLDPDAGYPVPLGFPKISDQTPEFFYETHSLSYEIAKRLRDLRSAEETKPTPQVYLSLVERWNDPLHFRRSEVEGPLRQAGFEICPKRMFLPPDLEEAREYLRQVMSPCLVFAQLLDDRPNDPPSDPTRSFYGLQLEVARELGLPILQLRPQQIDWPALSDAQRQLLEDATVRTGSPQAFSDAIIRAAREEQQRRRYPVPPPPPPPAPPTTIPPATGRPPSEPDGSPAADKAGSVEAVAEAGHAAAEAKEVTADPDEVVADGGGVTAEVDETTTDAEGTSEPRRVPAGRMIFVYNTQQDRDLARQVERTLESERLGYNGPIEERTDEEWDIDKEEELELRFGFEHCHASVMIYNRTQPFWVKFRLAYLSKLSLETSKWIGLLNGPEGCTPLRISGPTLKDIDCRSGYDEDRLLQFFAVLEKDPPS